MKNNRYTIAALGRCACFLLAHQPPRPFRHRVIRIIPGVGIAKASDVEAGSNIAPGAPTTGKSMNDAFNVHTLVAGEWS